METVECEYCGKTLPKSEATFCENGGFYACPDCADENLVTCERCGMLIDQGSAYSGLSEDGYLCECCHGDLFG